MTAMRSPATSTIASAVRKIWMLVGKAAAISGMDERRTSQLKNWLRTSDQPEERETASTIPPTTTTVLTIAMAAPRAPPPRTRLWRIRERRSPSSAGLLEEGGLDPDREPFALEPGELPARADLGQRDVHAAGQPAPVRQDEPEVLLRPRGLELAHDRGV